MKYLSKLSPTVIDGQIVTARNVSLQFNGEPHNHYNHNEHCAALLPAVKNGRLSFLTKFLFVNQKHFI
jgi:hypothetical protein